MYEAIDTIISSKISLYRLVKHGGHVKRNKKITTKQLWILSIYLLMNDDKMSCDHPLFPIQKCIKKHFIHIIDCRGLRQ